MAPGPLFGGLAFLEGRLMAIGGELVVAARFDVIGLRPDRL